jgi:hypothetical protein
MIRVDQDPNRSKALLLHEAERLEKLARDLRRLAEGDGPSDHDLDAAPVLEHWSMAERSLTCLVGIGSKHPRIPDGPVMTTEPWAIDFERRWVRTLSRWYVLGAARNP